MSPQNNYLPKGSIIKGVYQVESAIGMGYTAVILRCHDRRTSRKVAVKRFFPEKLEPRFREKAYAEARLKICGEYFVLGEEAFEENGHLHLVMPLVEGKALSKCLCDSGIDSIAATYIAMCITRACGELHSANILSTDIKPENVMILNNGIAKLIDLTFFEIAGQKAVVS